MTREMMSRMLRSFDVSVGDVAHGRQKRRVKGEARGAERKDQTQTMVDIEEESKGETAGHGARDGTARDGMARDGMARDGMARDGMARDGMARDGMATEGRQGATSARQRNSKTHGGQRRRRRGGRHGGMARNNMELEDDAPLFETPKGVPGGIPGDVPGLPLFQQGSSANPGVLASPTTFDTMTQHRICSPSKSEDWIDTLLNTTSPTLATFCDVRLLISPTIPGIDLH